MVKIGLWSAKSINTLIKKKHYAFVLHWYNYDEKVSGSSPFVFCKRDHNNIQSAREISYEGAII